MTIFKLNTRDKLLWLSAPAVYFAFIPYTEALFFLLGSIVLYGIKNNKKPALWVSLFLLSLTRPTGVILAPAFLAMCLFSNDNKKWHIGALSWLANYLLPMAFGTSLFIWYEYIKSGIWFVFFDIEKKFWGHSLNMPVLPFGNYAGPPLMWISALALFVGIFSFFYLLIRFIKWIAKNNTCEPLLIVSCGYLLMSILSVVLFNPTWGTNTTNLAGIYRYTFMNPFFYVFLYYFTNTVSYRWNDYLLIFVLSTGVWLLCGSYTHIQTFLYFAGNSVIVFFYMLHANKKLVWPAMILTGLNIFFQLHFFQQFISNLFPD